MEKMTSVISVSEKTVRACSYNSSLRPMGSILVRASVSAKAIVVNELLI